MKHSGMLAAHGPRLQYPGNWSHARPSAVAHVDLETLIRRTYGDDLLAAFDISPLREALPGRCHPLDDTSPLAFLYVGVPDKLGEYPILTLLDYDDSSTTLGSTSATRAAR